MKKLLVCILSLTLLFAFVGCKKEGKPISYPEEKKISFLLDGQEFALNSKGTFQAVRFRENPYDFIVKTAANSHSMSYIVDEKPVFQIAIVYFEGQTMNQVLAEIDEEITEKKVGDITYKYYESTFDDEYARQIVSHQYVYEKDDIPYIISFSFASVDTNLEQVFMENVRFVEK